MSRARDRRQRPGVTTPADQGAPRRGPLLVMAMVAGLALTMYLAARTPASPRDHAHASSRSVAPAAARAAPPPAATKASVESQVLARAAPRAVAEDAPSPEAAPQLDGTEHPHPITPAHQRIFEENNRVGAMNGAMDVGDFAALRRMNEAYRREYPEDDHKLQEGYALIADCLEERTPERIDAARRFWQTARASTLRRYVRRHCLEEQLGL